MLGSIKEAERNNKINRLFAMHMTKEDIQGSLEKFLHSMIYRTPITFFGRNMNTSNNVVVTDVINKIEAEDGSGRNFNISTMTQGTFFIKF